MRVAVLRRERDPLSLSIYRQNLVSRLSAYDVELSDLDEGAREAADVDLVWDPGLGMRRVPDVLCTTGLPVVATVHGLLGFTLSSRDRGDRLSGLPARLLLRARVARGWRTLGPKAAAVIAVSSFGAREIEHVLQIGADRLHVVHHGVDHAMFGPIGPVASRARPYFLIVAQQDRKSVV